MTLNRIAVSEFSTYRWDFEQDVLRLTRLGFEGLGVWREKLSDFGSEKAAELLADQSMDVSSLHWAGGFTGNTVYSFEEVLNDAVTAIKEAAKINADCLVVHTGGRNGHTVGHSSRLIRNALKELLPIANAHEVKLAIEPTHPRMGRDFSFLNQIDSALELIGEFGTANLGVVFDTYHIGHDERCLAKIEDFADQICLVQIADASYACELEQDRRIPGEGSLPLHNILALLAEAGYSGFYELELFGPSVAHISYESLVCRATEAVEELTKEIQISLRQN